MTNISDLEKVRRFFVCHPYDWFSKEEIRVGCDLRVGKDVTPRIRDLRKQEYGGMVIKMKKVAKVYRYCYAGGERYL